jgi:hypothetical protein
MTFSFTAASHQDLFQQLPSVVAAAVPLAGQGIAPADGVGPIHDGLVNGTGSPGLIPALPSSVDPRGIPRRPTDEVEVEGSELFAAAADLQDDDEVPDRPPPSKTGPEPEDGKLELEQFVVAGAMPAPVSGAIGPRPGVASSVDPSGIPTGGTAGPGSRFGGEEVLKPEDGCALDVIA